MNPRLSSSKSWTELPADFTDKVQTVFNNQFKNESKRGAFLVQGWIYPEEVVVRVGYLENGRLKQINFEASMDLPPRGGLLSGHPMEAEEDKTMERLYVSIDALGSLMEEYFELGDDDEEIDVPLRWRPYEFEGETVYLQHSTENSRLEEEANRLLGLTEKRLVQESSSTEDALGKAEVDTELAFEIQKAIRSGQYPRPTEN